MMQKGIVLVTVLVFGFLASIIFCGFAEVPRGPPSVNIEQTSSAAIVNQHVEITVTLGGGNPPYTFQWYTQLWTTWKPGMSYHLPALGPLLAFPGATSSTFDFVESEPGTYDISCELTDSLNDTYGLGPMPLYVIVSQLPTASSLPTPSSSPAHSPPKISYLSFQNQTFQSDSISLNFTLSQPTQWIGYSIDGQANKTIIGNTTLTGLTNGPHILTIYANDINGNTASPQTVAFVIAKPEPFPTTTIILISTAIVIVDISSGLVYRKHRKTLKEKSKT
jgi:hypothetical protein